MAAQTPEFDRISQDSKTIFELANCEDRKLAAARSQELTSQRIAATGRGFNLVEADLSGLNLSGLDLRQSVLNRAVLNGTNLSGASLQCASLVCPSMERANFSKADLSRVYMHALAAQVVNFTDANLSGIVDGTGSLFHGCTMRGARMPEIVLAGATFYQCDLTGAVLAGSNLQGATINECILDDADLTRTQVSQLTLTKCRLSGARFSEAVGSCLSIQSPTAIDGIYFEHAHLPQVRFDRMRGSSVHATGLDAVNADFQACSLSDAVFAGANLSRSRWSECTLERGVLTSSRLDEAVFRRCRFPGIAMAGTQAENVQFVECDLNRAEMRAFAGRCANFRDCNLEYADLRDVYLYRAMLTGDPPRAMCLKGAKLDNAVLTQSYICANLDGASIQGANAAYARLNQCSMREADLSGVNTFEASMVKVDFTAAKLKGLTPPFFVSRCPGLQRAIGEQADDFGTLLAFVEEFEGLCRSFKKGST